MFHKCKNSDEAKTLYRRLAKMLHPDKGGASDLMILMQEAYELFLSKHQKSDDDEEEMVRRYYEGFGFRKAKTETMVKPKAEPKFSEGKIYPGAYQETDEIITADDDEVGVFVEIYKYAKKHPKFNLGFTEQVFNTLNEEGFISAGSYNSVLKVYYAFFMHEWIKKNGV